MRHHITLAGKEILPIYYAIKEYEPDYIHIVFTAETESTASRIYSIIMLTTPCTLHKVSPYYIMDVVDVCNKLQGQFIGDEFIYNLTGGTKPMAFGAHSVALRNSAQVIYTSQQNEIINLNSYEATPMQCRLTNKEIIELSGQKLNFYNPLSILDTSQVKCAFDIKNFIEKHGGYYRQISKFIQSNYNSNSQYLPNEINISNSIHFQKNESGGFYIECNDNKLFDSDYIDSPLLFFEGRWWETLVANEIILWNSTKQKTNEIWQNVVFSLISEDPKVKNEVDILVNLGTTMLFVECKSGKITQSDVYKISQVRNTYGGEMSKTILVSYHPVSADIAEKCSEAQISLFAPQFPFQRSNHVKKLGYFLNNIILNLNT